MEEVQGLERMLIMEGVVATNNLDAYNPARGDGAAEEPHPDS